MLARRRIEPATLPADPLDELLTRLRSTIDGLPRPSRLYKAENALVGARQQRVEVWERLRAAIAENQRMPAPVIVSEIQRLQAELEAADENIRRLKADLRERRAVFLPEFEAAIRPIVTEAAEDALAAAARLGKFRALLAEAVRVAASSGLELSLVHLAVPDPTPFLPNLQKLAGKN